MLLKTESSVFMYNSYTYGRNNKHVEIPKLPGLLKAFKQIICVASNYSKFSPETLNIIFRFITSTITQGFGNWFSKY